MWGLITIGAIVLGIILVLMFAWRVVVPTNQAHIIQTRKKSVSYGGKDRPNGNVYYNIPSFIPIIWVKRIILPATIFDINIDNYEAFDNGRVPFKVNVKGFFRINDFNTAAERIESMTELKEQLTAIVSSAIRVILANKDINDILAERSSLGNEFMEAIVNDLADFGVTCTKNIELMDITDSENSQIIYNIQKKKESEIAKDARVSIAENDKIAQEKEIESERRVEIAKAEKEQEVGKKQVESKKEVAMQQEKANQEINEQKKLTIEKEMEVLKTEEIQKATIEKQKAEIEKEKEKAVKKLEAEAEAEAIKALAQGRKEAAKNDAEAIVERWKAEAEAKQAILEAEAEGERKRQEASVANDIAMLKEITQNQGASEYLQIVKAIEMYGLAEQKKAEALQKADIKYLATGSENKYGEFLGKLGLGLEGFNEMQGNEAISNIIWNIVQAFKIWKTNPQKEKVEQTKETTVEEVEDTDSEKKSKKDKNHKKHHKDVEIIEDSQK